MSSAARTASGLSRDRTELFFGIVPGKEGGRSTPAANPFSFLYFRTLRDVREQPTSVGHDRPYALLQASRGAAGSPLRADGIVRATLPNGGSAQPGRSPILLQLGTGEAELQAGEEDLSWERRY